MEILRPLIHYGLHFVFPIAVALVFFKSNWKKAYGLMLLTMLVDLDHLLASPIFDPNRCSIGFHPLHTLPAVGVYALMFLYPKTRIIGLGLLMHMATDSLDCYLAGLW